MLCVLSGKWGGGGAPGEDQKECSEKGGQRECSDVKLCEPGELQVNQIHK